MNDELATQWNKMLGDLGESLIAYYLKKLGWQVIGRKFRSGRASEIDLVARSNDSTLVFIEVKTRSITRIEQSPIPFSSASPFVGQDGLSSQFLDWYESAAQSINGRKRKQLIRAARQFCFENCLSFHGSRFDLIFLGLPLSTAQSLLAVHADFASPQFEKAIDELIDPDLFYALDARQRPNIIHCERAFVTIF